MFVSVVLLLICLDLAISVERVVGESKACLHGRKWLRFGRTDSDLILGRTSFLGGEEKEDNLRDLHLI